MCTAAESFLQLTRNMLDGGSRLSQLELACQEGERQNRSSSGSRVGDPFLSAQVSPRLQLRLRASLDDKRTDKPTLPLVQYIPHLLGIL